MARQYSHLQFLQHTPNALLARYLRERRGVLQEIAFDKLGELLAQAAGVVQAGTAVKMRGFIPRPI